MKRIEVDVLIIIEHKVRELESACLLKYEFEKRGYSVCIDSIFPNKELLPLKYSAKIIYFPWAYSDKSMEYVKCFLKYSPNAKYINLHQEQYSGQDEKNICLPSGDAKDLFHISWGKKFNDGLEKCGCEKDNIFIVGNMRLDFYKGKLKGMFYSKEELSQKYNISNDKKWVLFIANGYHLMPEWRIKKLEISDKNIKEKVNAAINCRKSFLDYVETYLQKNEDKVFIYRPHPSYADQDKHYFDIARLCEKYPNNFFVISDLPIGNWIVNVDVCISFHSTSAVECCASNTPYYLFRTTSLSKNADYSFFNDYKYIISNYDDFENALEGKNFDNNILKEILNDYYIMNDEYSFIKIVDKSLEWEKSNIKKYSVRMWIKNYIRYKIRDFILQISRLKIMKNFLMKLGNSRISRIIDNESDSFNQDDILNIMTKIKKCLDENEET